MADTTPRRIIWWEPRWAFVPRELRVIQSSFHLWAWVRIILGSAVVSLALATAMNRVMPGLQFDWIGAFVVSAAVVVGGMIGVVVLVLTVPPLVFVTEHGFGWWWPGLLHEGYSYIKRSELKSVTLTVRNDGKHYLRFRTNRFCKRVGLASGVDLDQLLELLDDLLVVRDRRQGSSKWMMTG